MKKLLCSIVLLCCWCYNYAQVGIGTTTPDASSILHIESTDKGLLIPQLTTAEVNAITTPANGLMVFNTDANEFQYNNGTPAIPNWVGFSSSNSPDSVKYSNTNTTYDLDKTTYNEAPIFGNLEWNDNSSTFSYVNEESIQINVTGRYKITTNLYYAVYTGGGYPKNPEVSLNARLYINNTATGTTVNSGYSNRGGGHTKEDSIHFSEVLSITAGQRISIRVRRAGDMTRRVSLKNTRGSNIYIEHIR